MGRITIILLLCVYGILKEFKPIEPYLYRYQKNNLNISAEILNGQVYPFWTYSYLFMLIPALLLTDILLYKPVLVVQSISYISVWLTLIFGRSVLSQQIGQILYGCATATDVAYYSYIYVKVEIEDYAIVTVLTRAALEAGKCLSYILSQLIILMDWGDLLTLNYISLGSLILTLFFAIALPFVSWRKIRNKHYASSNGKISIIACVFLVSSDSSKNRQISSYSEFALAHVRNFGQDIKLIIKDSQVRKWSIWWALATCGDLQIGNYIQTLWGEVQMNVHNAKIYNGFVEGLIPLFCAIALILLKLPDVNWSKYGEICLLVSSLVDCGLLLMLAITNKIYFMYIGYAIFRILYQCMITIAQFNIVCRIPANSCGFVFGFNMFVALILQTILTFLAVDSHGFSLGIRQQFLVYSGYHAGIAAIFLGALLFRWISQRIR